MRPYAFRLFVYLLWYTLNMTAFTPISSQYPKLVRDKIPEFIIADGQKPHMRVLEIEEYIQYLKAKATEEADEIAHTQTDEQLIEEIADLREVLDALQTAKGFSPGQVKEVQDKKRLERGGFSQRLLMLDNE